MRSDFIPGRDELFEAFATNLASKLPSYATTLGIPTATVTAITNEAAAFSTKLQYVVEITSSKKAAVSDKNTQRRETEELIRTINNLVQVSPNKTDVILNELLLPVRASSGAPRPAYIPQDLVAVGDGDNGNSLKWKRNGNETGTLFFIEFRVGDGPWNQLAVTTKSKYLHEDAVPGQQVTYRVYARTATQRSQNSNQATVYGPESSVFLQNAA